MQGHLVKIKSIQLITHDVLQIVTEKPDHYNFKPGQATEVAINSNDWKDKSRPFTFTSLPENEYLEFTIKTYASRNGVTKKLLQLEINDELILHDVFGGISYKGKGVFIAGGAGITPFISIFRFLMSKNEAEGNQLIFANKTKRDIILEKEFRSLLGKNFINILSVEKSDEYAYGQITGEFLKKTMDPSLENIYVCGPPIMEDSIVQQLSVMGTKKDSITVEEF